MRKHDTTKGFYMNSFFAINLKSTFGGWVVYRNGDVFASSFPTEKEAKQYAKGFCELNGIRFVWAR